MTLFENSFTMLVMNYKKVNISATRVAIRQRNYKIKATYESIPGWTLKELAKMFEVSIPTVHYAIHGRPSKQKSK